MRWVEHLSEVGGATLCHMGMGCELHVWFGRWSLVGGVCRLWYSVATGVGIKDGEEERPVFCV